MDYKVIGRKIPGQPSEPEKYYASIVRPKNVTLDTLSKRIAEISPVNELDTKSVLIAFTKVLPEYLVDGATVELGDLGRLMVTLSSSGADTPEDFKSDLIKGNKVSYQMSTEVKKVMKAAEYEKI
ncbi:HU family DNA-binding protein [Carboxylicivirga linearis]|uniref:HU domain-containing protein n=1 Tax=Carboxylicivirga linearis TaxID=1628157 RepID=A0ABS5JY07_9BACT|nr:hypothetical protein [Carboxylicivirga linearis]MBS2099724.1 hypothetical protein [Carboxylicivirga linearis]